MVISTTTTTAIKSNIGWGWGDNQRHDGAHVGLSESLVIKTSRAEPRTVLPRTGREVIPLALAIYYVYNYFVGALRPTSTVPGIYQDYKEGSCEMCMQHDT